jgi:hypothetical protein
MQVVNGVLSSSQRNESTRTDARRWSRSSIPDLTRFLSGPGRFRSEYSTMGSIGHDTTASMIEMSESSRLTKTREFLMSRSSNGTARLC